MPQRVRYRRCCIAPKVRCGCGETDGFGRFEVALLREIPIASRAPRRATPVWVNAAGLKIRNATPSAGARCTRSISSCSTWLWKPATSWPAALPPGPIYPPGEGMGMRRIGYRPQVGCLGVGETVVCPLFPYARIGDHAYL